MIIQNHRKTEFENNVIHALKLSLGCKCAGCGSGGPTADFWKFKLTLDDKFVNNMDVPKGMGPHAYVYSQFLAGEIPAEHIGVICNRCSRKKYIYPKRPIKLNEAQNQWVADQLEKSEESLDRAGFSPEHKEAFLPLLENDLRDQMLYAKRNGRKAPPNES